MKFYLIVAKGRKQGQPIPISVDLFLIGTGKVCQLRCTGSRRVGEQQCALVTRDRKVFVRDLGSEHPTMVNNSLLPPGEEWPLHAGDRLEIGPLEFVIQFNEKALSQRDLEEWALKCLDTSAELDFDDPDEDLRSDHDAATPAQAAAAIFDKLQARRGLVQGRLRIGRDAGITTIRFNDIFLVEEAEIALVKKELIDHLNKSNLRVLLDFKNVRRMSTAAVTMVEEVHNWLKPWGSSLALCRVRPELQGILATLGLNERIPHFADKKRAFTSKW